MIELNRSHRNDGVESFLKKKSFLLHNNIFYKKVKSFKNLEEKNNDVLYKELPRISWAISKLTQVVENNDISSLLTRYLKKTKREYSFSLKNKNLIINTYI